MPGLELPHHLADGVVLGANGAEVGDRFGPVIRGIGHSDGVFVRIQADKQCAMFFSWCCPPNFTDANT